MALVLAYLEPQLWWCGSLPSAPPITGPQNGGFTTLKGQIKHLSADSCTNEIKMKIVT